MHTIASKKEAFAKARDVEEISIPIDRSQYNFKFRRRWFRIRNQVSFSSYLPKHFPANRPYNFLTIGVFEGAQEVWLLQNILKHPQSRLVCLDPWAYIEKLGEGFMEQSFVNAQHNLFPWKDQVTLIRGYSQDVLAQAIDDNGLVNIKAGDFDFLIIDGDHGADPAYIDMCNCYHLAKKNAWILCDDVRNRIYKENHVKQGLERFLTEYEDKVEIAWEHRFVSCLRKLQTVLTYRQHVIDLVNQYIGKTVKSGAEIGVWEARTSFQLLQKFQYLHMYLIDDFDPDCDLDKTARKKHNMENVLRNAMRRTQCYADRRTVIIDKSTRASKLFQEGSLDFIFIDGSHFYERIKEDLEHWIPKVRAGGLVSGHDYDEKLVRRWNFGVNQAVDEYVAKHGYTLGPMHPCARSTVWHFIK